MMRISPALSCTIMPQIVMETINQLSLALHDPSKQTLAKSVSIHMLFMEFGRTGLHTRQTGGCSKTTILNLSSSWRFHVVFDFNHWTHYANLGVIFYFVSKQLGASRNMSRCQFKELSITPQPFLCLENCSRETQFSMLGTKPMFQILHILLYLHENRGQN
jgi:hypothetical protein